LHFKEVGASLLDNLNPDIREWILTHWSKEKGSLYDGKNTYLNGFLKVCAKKRKFFDKIKDYGRGVDVHYTERVWREKQDLVQAVIGTDTAKRNAAFKKIAKKQAFSEDRHPTNIITPSKGVIRKSTGVGY
jgi:hypothetical protein